MQINIVWINNISPMDIGLFNWIKIKLVNIAEIINKCISRSSL